MTLVDQVRHFNRFYTRQIGLLARHLPASSLSLAEARVLYELAHAQEQTAAGITRTLRMDKAHVSRIVGRFRAAGWLRTRLSPEHAKHKLLSLTVRGRRSFRRLDQGTQAQIQSLVAPLTQTARQRLARGMREVQQALQAGAAAGAVSLRPLRVGDLGWIAHRQGVLYQQEYGWDWTFEGLVCSIVGEFAAHFDSAREDAWVAERGGQIVGCVFLVRAEAERTAQLRLLYVDPAARGLGVGTRLVQRCIERARQLGYRTVTLWTNDVLVSARRIYEAAGFALKAQRRHRSFGKDLTGQVWTLELADPAAAGRGPSASRQGRPEPRPKVRGSAASVPPEARGAAAQAPAAPRRRRPSVPERSSGGPRRP